jgi:hypothetical protein
VAITSFRTSLPPSAKECDEKVAPRPVLTCMLAMWNASTLSSWTL